MSEQSRELSFVQVFGSSSTFNINESDIITCVSFSLDGKHIAVGDHGGRLVIFERNDNSSFEFMTEFQSHYPAFDSLKSQDIPEKINDASFLKQGCPSFFTVLTTNDKTIKSFKISTKNSFDILPKHSSDYAKAHQYHIHTINVASDQGHFFSVDDLRVNFWDITRNDICFTLVDNKPENLSTLSEVISAFDSSPTDSSLFSYATTSGLFTLCDMRLSSTFHRDTALMFEDQSYEAPSKTNFPTVTESIASLRFSHDGQKIAIRDYLCAKIWDIRNSHQPEAIIPIHNQVISDLNELYDREIVFDTFDVNWSCKDEYLVTGSYSNRFILCDTRGEWGILNEAKRYIRPKGSVVSPPMSQGLINVSSIGSTYYMKNYGVINDRLPRVTDYDKKIVCCECSPTEDMYAVATLNNLFIYKLS